MGLVYLYKTLFNKILLQTYSLVGFYTQFITDCYSEF
jgi:hypothetical protein